MRKFAMIGAAMAVFVLFAGNCSAQLVGVQGQALTLPLVDAGIPEDSIVQTNPVLTPVYDYYYKCVDVRFNETGNYDESDYNSEYTLNMDGHYPGSQYILKATDAGYLPAEGTANGVSPFVTTYTLPSLWSSYNSGVTYHDMFVLTEEMLARLYAELGAVTPQPNLGTLVVLTRNRFYISGGEVGVQQIEGLVYGATGIVNYSDGSPAGIIRYIEVLQEQAGVEESALQISDLGINLVSAPTEDTIGFIVFNLNPGALMVSAQKTGYEFGWRPAFIYGGCVTSGVSRHDAVIGIDLTQLQTGDVSGNLLNEKGNPVSGATVELCGMQDAVAPQTTAADGSFTLPGVPPYYGVIVKASRSGYKDTYMLIMRNDIAELTADGIMPFEEPAFVIVSDDFADGLEPPLRSRDIDEGKGIIIGRVEDVMGNPVKEAGVEAWKDSSVWIPADYFDCMGEELSGTLERTSDSGLFAVLEEMELTEQSGFEPALPLYLDFSTESADFGYGSGSYYYSPHYLGFIFADGVTVVPMRTYFPLGHVEVSEGGMTPLEVITDPDPYEYYLLHLMIETEGLPEEEPTAAYAWTGYLYSLKVHIEGTGSLNEIQNFSLYRADKYSYLTNIEWEIDTDNRTVIFRPASGYEYMTSFESDGTLEIVVSVIFSDQATGTYRAVWEKNCDMLVNTGNPLDQGGNAQQLPYVPVSVSGASIPAAEEAMPDLVRGGTNCFIATAAFGSPFERHVQMLREFRDRYLLTNTAGRAFVRWYYAHSPKYAAVIVQNEALRAAARIALMPVYGIAFLLMKGLIPYLMLGLGLFLLTMRRKMAKTTMVLLAVALLFGVSSTGFAADANHFKVAPGEQYTVIVPTTDIVGGLDMKRIAADFFYSYADSPVEIVIGGVTEDMVKKQHLINAAVTLGINENAQVSLTIPYSIKQDSDIAGVDDSGLGDIVLGGKYRFASRDMQGFGFAVVPYIQIPVGNEDALMGIDSGLGAGIRAVYDRMAGENMLFTANIGYAYQQSEKLVQIDIDNSLLFGAALTYLFPNRTMFVTGEIYGRSEELFESEQTPVEAMLSWGYTQENASFMLGAGIGIVDGYGASGWRLFTGVRFGM